MKLTFRKFCAERTAVWVGVFLLCVMCASLAQPLQRVPNSTIAMPASPPTFGYTATNAFGTLTFTNPVAMASPPGETNRLFIVEKHGHIMVITNLAAPNKTLFMDISNRVTSTPANTGGSGEQGVLGLAFHPGYATNRYFFVFYTGPATTPAGTGLHDVIARFETSAGNPHQGNAASEVRLIAQFDQDSNHDGGDIKFGPDGYLYVPLGDEGAGNDTRANSQRINKDFFSAILRLDVDKRPGSLNPNPHASIIAPTNYAVPSDNPFIGATTFNGIAVNPTQVRTEFWAVGLRNPWRMHFDSLTGTLYCADVGQSSREEVNVITRGGNYGWNYWEGFLQRTNPTPAGFTNALPLVDYNYISGQRVCIIGGVVSRGARLSQLYGAYLYADYLSGEIWQVRHSGPTLTQSNLLFNAGTGERIATFGTDPANGDVLYAAHFTTAQATGARIKRIIYNSVTNGAPVPTTLAGTGAFTNLATLTPHAGIVPYDINVPFWSDHAIKSRWFSVPNTNLSIGFNANANWSFPTGTVWVKHFELELTNGVPESRKRLETRLLVKRATGTYGVSYRWGDSTTNATLVSEAGLDESFVINEGGGILRTQVWRYPSWVECQACHTSEGGFGLGFNTPQLNHDFNYGSGLTNQILALSQAGYFSTGVTNTSGLMALAHATNASASLEHRVRSYLTANCVQCHQPGGTAQQANWDARITPSAQAGIINGPLTDNFGDASNRVIAPLSLTNSMLHTRIGMRGPRQMPPLATAIVDTQSVALVAEWIGSLSNTFWLGATPHPLNLTAGSAGDISVSVLPTSDFTNQVSLGLSGIPYGTHAAFNPPTISVTSTSVLRVTTSAATPVGSYALSLSGVGGGASNTTIAILNVSPFASTYSFEAEDIPFVPNGAAAAIQFDVNSSAGEWEALLADGVGDYIDYTIPSLPAGTYHFKMMYKAHPNRGILSMTLDGNLVTNALDQYSAATTYPDLSFGNRSLATSGSHVIRQTVVGRNVAAGAFTLSADRFTFEGLTPPTPAPPVVNQAALLAGNLVIAGSAGVTNGLYYVMASTDVTQPRSAWTVVATNLFDASGNFNFSIPIQPGTTQQFYLLKLP